jgi:hypothetical protein
MFLTVVLPVSATTTQVTDNDMVYNLGEGYYNYGTGLSRDETYDVALRIKDPALVGCRVKAVRIWFDAIEGLSDAKAWLSKEIGIKSLKFAGADVQTVAFDVQQGSNEVAFTPYTMTEEGIYVGYTVTAAKDVAKEPIRLTGSTTADGMYIHTSGLYRASFHSMYGEQGDLAVEVLLEGDFCQNAAAATMVKADYTLTSECSEAVVNFANYGKSGVESLDYTVSIAGISESHHVQLPTPVPAVYGRQWQMTVEVPAPKVQGIHAIEVNVTKVNDAPNEWAAPSASDDIRCYEQIPTHRAVLEEYTGTWCGYCPRGFVGLEEMNRLHPADFIGISYHNKDPMEVIAAGDYPWNTDVLGGWPGFPAAVLDRHLTTDAFYGGSGLGNFGIEYSWLRVCKVLAPADVDVNTRWTDDHTLEAEAVVTFPFNTDDVHYALQFVLTSDGLSGTTGDWSQANYYKGNTNLPASMDVFTKGDNYVSGLVFNDVYVGWSGRDPIAGSLPAQVTGETPYSYKYLFDVSTLNPELVADLSKLRVNVLLIDTNTTHIANANKAWAGNNSQTAVKEVRDAREDVKSETWYTLDGRRLNGNPTKKGLYVKNGKKIIK